MTAVCPQALNRLKMKSIYSIFSILIFVLISTENANSQDISLSAPMIDSPIEMVGNPSVGKAELSFRIVNETNFPLDRFSTDPLMISISLARLELDFESTGTFNDAILGTYADKFNWSYDPVTKFIFGEQIATITERFQTNGSPGADYQGRIRLKVKTTEETIGTSPADTSSHLFNVNLIPPNYGNNDANNDNVSGATYTKDVDDDDDGIKDEDDNCTNHANADQKDTDGDGFGDVCDIDDDNDGILDSIENSGARLDTDGDLIPDSLDLDSDNDGILDVVEAGGTDANNDGMADGTIDSVNGGIPTSALGLIPVDTDGDSYKDFQDLDSDNDGMSDLAESGRNIATSDTNDNGVLDNGNDVDKDGIIDAFDGNTSDFGDQNSLVPRDRDSDLIPDYKDIDSDDASNTLGNGNDDIFVNGYGSLDNGNTGRITFLDDDDEDGIVNLVDARDNEFGWLGLPDKDGDDVANIDDLDDDNDGISDLQEIADSRNNGDTDGDGIPNHLDLDSDNDGILDVIEANGTDANNDGIADGTVGNTATTNGIPSSANEGLTPPNTDGEGPQDYVDLDSDDDGASDLVESGEPNYATMDTDNNGVIDTSSTSDLDADGIQSPVDASTSFGDSSSPLPVNSDSDAIPDYRDLDRDNNPDILGSGSDDVSESGNSSLDTDRDGRVDDKTDADYDGILDAIDDKKGEFGGLKSPSTDLIPRILASPSVFVTDSSTMNVIVTLSEVNNLTSSGDIYVVIPNLTSVSFQFDQSLTKVGFQNVNNSDWTYDGLVNNFHTFKLSSLVGKGVSKFGLVATVYSDGTDSTQAITVRVVDGSGGDVNEVNNSDSEFITIK